MPQLSADRSAIIWDCLRLNVTSSVFGYSDQDQRELKNEVSLCWPELDLGKKKNG